jgi:predicted Fe-Mo cluster-binding NifX family protein
MPGFDDSENSKSKERNSLGIYKGEEIIAVTINKPDRNSLVSDVFGRCGFFLICDRKNLTERILNNPFTSELGGAGIQSARLLIENDADAVITDQIGCNPLRLLVSANVKVYQCEGETAVEALRLFDEGKLIQIEETRYKVPFHGKHKRFGRNF